MRTIGVIVVFLALVAGGIVLLSGRAEDLVVQAVQGAPEDPPPPTAQELIDESERDFDAAEVALKRRWVDIYNAEAEAARIEGNLALDRENLAHEELILLRTQELLEGRNPGDEIVVGGVPYSYQQVNGDALERVGSCETLRRVITQKEQSLAKLNKACHDGHEIIRSEVEELRRERIEFESDKVELAALRAQRHVDSVIGRVYESGDVETDLGQARQAFNQYLANERGGAEFDQQIGGLQSGVVATWNQELGIEPDSAFAAVSNYFQDDDSEPDLTDSLEESLQNE